MSIGLLVQWPCALCSYVVTCLKQVTLSPGSMKDFLAVCYSIPTTMLSCTITEWYFGLSDVREGPSIVLANICVRQREQRLFELWEWGLTITIFLSCSCFLLRQVFVSFHTLCIQRNKTRWIFHTFTVNNGLMKWNWPVHSRQLIKLPLEGISVFHDWVLSNLCQVCNVVTCAKMRPDAFPLLVSLYVNVYLAS